MVRIQMKTPSSSLLALALLSFLLGLAGSLLSVFYYIPNVYPFLKTIGIYMQQTRATHTTFSIAWIFLASVALIYRYFEDSPEGLSTGELRRARAQIYLWVLAGIAAFLGFLGGIYSGREYVEYHPFCSLLILAGWILFTWNLMGRFRDRFWQSPVYIYMWAIGALLFIWTYTEGHLWFILNYVSHPIKDIQIQWKSLGAMVGSFNLLVYGCGIYLAGRLNQDDSYAQSKTAFALFGVGLLNSLTNYVHHTYHLPQNLTVKWIAFVISMLEIIILLKVLFDLSRPLRSFTNPRIREVERFLQDSKWWTMGNLVLSILISIPPVNTLIHGTHVVVAHAMGTTIGIDTFILFAVCSWLLSDDQGARCIPRWQFFALNISLSLFLLSLFVMGCINGMIQYWHLTKPESLMNFATSTFEGSGCLLAFVLGWITLKWLLQIARRLKQNSYNSYQNGQIH